MSENRSYNWAQGGLDFLSGIVTAIGIKGQEDGPSDNRYSQGIVVTERQVNISPYVYAGLSAILVFSSLYLLIKK